MAQWSVESIDDRKFKFDLPVPDRLKIQKQNFTVLSVIAPTGTNQTAKDLMIRVYGCCDTLETANALAKKLRDSNDFFDIYVMPNFEWIPLPPRVDEIDYVNYTEKRIQTIRDSYVDHIRGEKAAMVERLQQDEQERKNRDEAAKIKKREMRKYYDRKRRPKVPIDQIPMEFRRKAGKNDAKGVEALDGDSDFSDAEDDKAEAKDAGGVEEIKDANDEGVEDEGVEESKA